MPLRLAGCRIDLQLHWLAEQGQLRTGLPDKGLGRLRQLFQPARNPVGLFFNKTMDLAQAGTQRRPHFDAGAIGMDGNGATSRTHQRIGE